MLQLKKETANIREYKVGIKANIVTLGVCEDGDFGRAENDIFPNSINLNL